MDTGLTVTRVSSAPSIGLRAEPAIQAAVATELDAAQSVTAATDGHASSGYDPALVPPQRPDTALNIVLDPQSREVIFREISKQSGEIIDQVPGDAMLKLRAYYREIANPDPDHKVLEKTT
jgi:hypothetical protein